MKFKYLRCFPFCKNMPLIIHKSDLCPSASSFRRVRHLYPVLQISIFNPSVLMSAWRSERIIMSAFESFMLSMVPLQSVFGSVYFQTLWKYTSTHCSISEDLCGPICGIPISILPDLSSRNENVESPCKVVLWYRIVDTLKPHKIV